MTMNRNVVSNIVKYPSHNNVNFPASTPYDEYTELYFNAQPQSHYCIILEIPNSPFIWQYLKMFASLNWKL